MKIRGGIMAKPENVKILQLKISIDGTKPPVWRRILIEGNATFFELHNAIQNAVGWTDSHLHEFIVAGAKIAPKREEPENTPDFDSKKTMLSQFLEKEGRTILYVYDFGDDWLHKIKVEKILAKEKGKKYPVCIDGAMNCPPEDCGGVWGYENFKKAISNKKHSEHKEMLDWVGGYFDQKEFDTEETNVRLGHKRKKPGRPAGRWVYTR